MIQPINITLSDRWFYSFRSPLKAKSVPGEPGCNIYISALQGEG
nr:MAG TPA: hypothetical protein [Caudoviricetes sp.]